MMLLNPLFYMQAVVLALSQIWANKMRAFLTALGIIIGVASVNSVVAALSGLKTMVLSELAKFGANKIFIFPDHPDDAPDNAYSMRQIMLKQPEMHLILDHCPSVSALTPMTQLSSNIQAQEKTLRGVRITGIWPSWHSIENRRVTIGRPFGAIDEDSARQVCLVNDRAVQEMRLPSDPSGQSILIEGRRFLIIGVVETIQSALFSPATPESEVFIPFSTAARMQNPDFFFFIIAQTTSPEAADEAKAEIRFVLRKARQLRPDEPDTFHVEALQKYIDQFQVIAAGITMIAGGIVGISLLVGGIGIMNIMLVSVSERTREIGLRKAIGATPTAILMQFLLEAVTLCCVGGFIGVACGQGFAMALSKIPSAHFQASVPWWAVMMSFGFSAGVGVIFGMFPAIKAARLDPIDALRHE